MLARWHSLFLLALLAPALLERDRARTSAAAQRGAAARLALGLRQASVRRRARVGHTLVKLLDADGLAVCLGQAATGHALAAGTFERLWRRRRRRRGRRGRRGALVVRNAAIGLGPGRERALEGVLGARGVKEITVRPAERQVGYKSIQLVVLDVELAELEAFVERSGDGTGERVVSHVEHGHVDESPDKRRNRAHQVGTLQVAACGSGGKDGLKKETKGGRGSNCR